MWTKSCLSLILFFVVHTRKEGFVLWRHFSKLFFSFFFFFFFFVKIHNFVSSFRTKIYSFLGAFVTLFASRFSLLSRKTTTTNLLWTTHSRQHAKPLRSSSKREPRRCCSSVVVFVIVSIGLYSRPMHVPCIDDDDWRETRTGRAAAGDAYVQANVTYDLVLYLELTTHS